MSWNPTGYQFAWEVVSEYKVWLLEGVLLSLKVAAVAMLFAMALGLVIALCRMSPIWPLRTFASLYTSVFRAIPLLVFILWMYYGVTLVTGLNIDAFAAGVLCLTLQYAAWLAEIYRAGLQAIDKGQREAALSTGLSRTRAFSKVIWPQAWRIIIPPLANNFVGILKDSSLVGIIGVNELMRQSQIAVSLSFRPFELYTAAMVIYIALTLLIARFSSVLEQRAARSLSVQTRRGPRTARTLGTAA
ncbi:MAG: amino acid ABC transporter permease [Chloroflexi bacterium]|nr:MAG: amino acid ABC transporter permease [Chloroflexota bacterium]TMG65673.1 MAG: amino acid ABC transporter permease [Chloroflexota bacterium]